MSLGEKFTGRMVNDHFDNCPCSFHIHISLLPIDCRFCFLVSFQKPPSAFPCVAGVCISCLVISHVLSLADILFKTPLFPFLIGLWFDIWLLFGSAQVFIYLFTFISGIRSYTWITESQLRFHIFQEWHQSPCIIPVLENIGRYNVFAVYRDLDIISRFLAGHSSYGPLSCA